MYNYDDIVTPTVFNECFTVPKQISYLEKHKQDKLTAGTNITINDNVISSTGGSGVTVENTLTSTSTTNALSANMGKKLQDEKQANLIFDAEPTAGSTNMVNSGVVQAAIAAVSGGGNGGTDVGLSMKQIGTQSFIVDINGDGTKIGTFTAPVYIVCHKNQQLMEMFPGATYRFLCSAQVISQFRINDGTFPDKAIFTPSSKIYQSSHKISPSNGFGDAPIHGAAQSVFRYGQLNNSANVNYPANLYRSGINLVTDKDEFNIINSNSEDEFTTATIVCDATIIMDSANALATFMNA